MHSPPIPPIRIFERDGKVYTLDHRRLVAARLAGKPLRYKKATPEEVGKETLTKFRTQDDGQRVEIIEKRSPSKRGKNR